MDSPDLISLLQHFDQKISRVTSLLPWAQACTLVVQKHDDSVCGQESPSDIDKPLLPDLTLLSQLMLDMEESIYEIDDFMDLKRKRLEKQKTRIRNLMLDIDSHLEHISSNFPLNFGKSPEKPKNQKYGINAQNRKSVAPGTRTGPTAGKTVNATGRAGSKGPVARSGKAPVGSNKAAVANREKETEAPTRKTVLAPAVITGPAVVGSKSSKPAIPVRMTKKFITRFNHNVNSKS